MSSARSRGRAEYYRLGERLRERGLQEAVGEPVLCRWRNSEPRLVLDVMPTDPDILGFSNPWYEEAIATATTIGLDSGAEIRAATPVLLTATKLCAWKGRGRGDLLRSLDVHDVLMLVDGLSVGAERAAVVRARIDSLLV